MTIWVIVGIVVIALLAFFALQRPEATESTLENAGNEAADGMERAAIRTETAADLMALRVRAEAGESYADLESEFALVRAKIAAAYDNAEGEAKEEWRDLQVGFDEFEASARTGTSNFLDDLNGLIARFSADVRTESE